jgi:tRNA-specific 2-thiouridylase
VHRFTIGQRKGLGIAAKARLYVLKIDADSGDVTVGPRSALERANFTVSGVNWIERAAPHSWLPATVQIRHRHRPAPGRVRAIEGGRAEFALDEPQPAVTPGQAAVFYDGDTVIGGGWIENS